jgi:hypothetical protein
MIDYYNDNLDSSTIYIFHRFNPFHYNSRTILHFKVVIMINKTIDI